MGGKIFTTRRHPQARHPLKVRGVAALLETQQAPAEIEGARGAGGGDEFGEEAEAGRAAIAGVGAGLDETGGAQAGEVFARGHARFANPATEFGGGKRTAIEEQAEDAMARGLAEDGQQLIGAEARAQRGCGGVGLWNWVLAGWERVGSHTRKRTGRLCVDVRVEGKVFL